MWELADTEWEQEEVSWRSHQVDAEPACPRVWRHPTVRILTRTHDTRRSDKYCHQYQRPVEPRDRHLPARLLLLLETLGCAALPAGQQHPIQRIRRRIVVPQPVMEQLGASGASLASMTPHVSADTGQQAQESNGTKEEPGDDARMLRLVLDFLRRKNLLASYCQLAQESQCGPTHLSSDMLFLRDLVYSGRWRHAREFVAPLRGVLSPNEFDRVLYRLYLQEFLELVSSVEDDSGEDDLSPAPLSLAERDDGDVQTVSAQQQQHEQPSSAPLAALATARATRALACLQEAKPVCSPQEFNSMCFCLTLPQVRDNPDFGVWERHQGRIDCFEFIHAKSQHLFPDRMDSEWSQDLRLEDAVLSALQPALLRTSKDTEHMSVPGSAASATPRTTALSTPRAQATSPATATALTGSSVGVSASNQHSPTRSINDAARQRVSQGRDTAVLENGNGPLRAVSPTTPKMGGITWTIPTNEVDGAVTAEGDRPPSTGPKPSQQSLNDIILSPDSRPSGPTRSRPAQSPGTPGSVSSQDAKPHLSHISMVVKSRAASGSVGRKSSARRYAGQSPSPHRASSLGAATPTAPSGTDEAGAAQDGQEEGQAAEDAAQRPVGLAAVLDPFNSLDMTMTGADNVGQPPSAHRSTDGYGEPSQAAVDVEAAAEERNPDDDSEAARQRECGGDVALDDTQPLDPVEAIEEDTDYVLVETLEHHEVSAEQERAQAREQEQEQEDKQEQEHNQEQNTAIPKTGSMQNTPASWSQDPVGDPVVHGSPRTEAPPPLEHAHDDSGAAPDSSLRSGHSKSMGEVSPPRGSTAETTSHTGTRESAETGEAMPESELRSEPAQEPAREHEMTAAEEHAEHDRSLPVRGDSSLTEDFGIPLDEQDVTFSCHPLLEESAPLRCIATSPGGEIVAVGSNAKWIGLLYFAVDSGGAITVTLEMRLQDVHRASVYGMEFSPDSRLLASCSNDRTVRLLEFPSEAFESAESLRHTNVSERAHVLKGHTGTVRCVRFLGEDGGQVLSSGSGDFAVRLWDTSALACTQTLTGHTAAVHDLCILDRGLGTFASVSDDHTVRVWDPRAGDAAVAAFQAPPDDDSGNVGSIYSIGALQNAQGVPGKGTYFMTGHANGRVCLWDLRSQEVAVENQEEHRGDVRSLRWSATTPNLCATAAFDNTCKLWSLCPPEEDPHVRDSATLSPGAAASAAAEGAGSPLLVPLATIEEHHDRVLCAAWHPVQSCLFTTAADGRAVLNMVSVR